MTPVNLIAFFQVSKTTPVEPRGRIIENAQVSFLHHTYITTTYPIKYQDTH